MEIYNSEEEQVEALRRWWQKNGRTVLTLAALVLLAVAGWKFWGDYQRQRAEAASLLYAQMLAQAEADPAAAAEQGRAILASYPSSTYADYASLMLARLAVEQNDLDQAAAHLRGVADSAKPPLRDVARLRLGRVLLAQEKPDEALALIRAEEPAPFRPAFEELKGDAYLAKGRIAEARTAYGDALAGYDVPAKQQVVKMKLDDLAASAAAAPAGGGTE